MKYCLTITQSLSILKAYYILKHDFIIRNILNRINMIHQENNNGVLLLFQTYQKEKKK